MKWNTVKGGNDHTNEANAEVNATLKVGFLGSTIQAHVCMCVLGEGEV